MRILVIGMIVVVSFALSGQVAAGQDSGPNAPRRMVLVELYTSQGCDMCPAAEKILGVLAEKDRGIVPIAFHVDYFNDPWKDVFSDPLYSRRQMTYNQFYTGPKNPEYGLYYTPMLMVDGVESVNGRDLVSAEAAIRRALARKPAVGLDATVNVAADGLSGTATIEVTSRSPRVERTPLLVCAVLREDGVVTDVGSGENRGKSLVARFPARRTKYEFIELDGKSSKTQRFKFDVEPTWDRRNLRLAVFVQDKRNGAVYQATDLPWWSPRPDTRSDKGSSSVRRTTRPGDDPKPISRSAHRPQTTPQPQQESALMIRRPSSGPLVGLVAILLSAAATEAGPPGAGDTAPDFTLEGLRGESVRLATLREKGPVVLVVLRGWPGYQCPICTRQVGELIGKSSEIAASKARVVLVYPGPAEGLKAHADEFVRGKTLPDNFHIVLDPDYAFTKSYDLRWDALKETAYPSTFVIDSGGRVAFAKVSRSHGDRAKVGDVLQALGRVAR